MWSMTKPAGWLSRRRAGRGTGASSAFVQIAQTIADDIRRGALRGGDRLPSTRDLAAQLAVNRNTVVAAYDELMAQGWVASRGPGGTFVCDALPERGLRRAPPVPAQGLPWRDRSVARGVAFSTARDFALDARPRPYLRLAYARYDEAELGDAVRRMRRALDDR